MRRNSEVLALFLWIYLISQASTLFSQSPEENLMKYWKHREQLDRFILKIVGLTRSAALALCLASEKYSAYGIIEQSKEGNKMPTFV